MSAMMETISGLSSPARAASEVGLLNQRLAGERTIPPEIAETVREIAEAVDQTTISRWETIDPRHALIVLHSAISAQRAIDDPDSSEARDQLRLALDSLGQALAAIAEREAVADDRSPKDLLNWLAATTEVPQNRIAALLGVSLRRLQRWLSANESSQPEGEELRRVRALARIVNQLRFVLTPAGTVDWFDWPRGDLEGQTPGQLLRDPARLPDLVAIAGSMRASYAG
jgi:hypothetical protein